MLLKRFTQNVHRQTSEDTFQDQARVKFIRYYAYLSHGVIEEPGFNEQASPKITRVLWTYSMT